MDEERREVALGVEVREKPDPVWGVKIGEILHNLRSALDHAFYDIARRDRMTTHNRSAFPIFLDSGRFELERSRRKPPGILRGIADDSFAIIQAAQPYNTGEDTRSPLWQLYELSNWDKHRHLQLAGGVMQRIRLILPPMYAGTVTPLNEMNLGPFEENAEILRVHVSAWFMDPNQVHVDVPPAFNVVFGRNTPVPRAFLVPCLGRIGHRVHELIERIGRRLFP